MWIQRLIYSLLSLSSGLSSSISSCFFRWPVLLHRFRCPVRALVLSLFLCCPCVPYERCGWFCCFFSSASAPSAYIFFPCGSVLLGCMPCLSFCFANLTKELCSYFETVVFASSANSQRPLLLTFPVLG